MTERFRPPPPSWPCLPYDPPHTLWLDCRALLTFAHATRSTAWLSEVVFWLRLAWILRVEFIERHDQQQRWAELWRTSGLRVRDQWFWYAAVTYVLPGTPDAAPYAQIDDTTVLTVLPGLPGLLEALAEQDPEYDPMAITATEWLLGKLLQADPTYSRTNPLLIAVDTMVSQLAVLDVDGETPALHHDGDWTTTTTTLEECIQDFNKFDALGQAWRTETLEIIEIAA